jgi:hypothetical protein
MVIKQKSGVKYAKTESMPDNEELGAEAGISSALGQLCEILSCSLKKIDKNHQLGSFDVSPCQFFIYATHFRLHTDPDEYQCQSSWRIINSQCPTLSVGIRTTRILASCTPPKKAAG